jgi:hypothetical protein
MCVDNAVTRVATGTTGDKDPPEAQSQSVVFKTSMIDKMSDITDTLNVCEMKSTMDWCSQVH